jgi:diacylglycerol kinase (ATP)
VRITLLHNPKAGGRKHNRKQLLKALGRADHDAIYRSTKNKGWKRALKKRADVVIVAGGDGAVAKVAAKLINRGKPLAILPLGTANNLARSLGFLRRQKKLSRNSETGRKKYSMSESP